MVKTVCLQIQRSGRIVMKQNIARRTLLMVFGATLGVSTAARAQAVVVFNPASLTFGCIVSPFTWRCSPPPKTTTLTNTGSKTLSIGSITITGSTYVFSQANNCGTSVADRKSTRLNSSHRCISYAVFCLKKKKKNHHNKTRKTQQVLHAK